MYDQQVEKKKEELEELKKEKPVQKPVEKPVEVVKEEAAPVPISMQDLSDDDDLLPVCSKENSGLWDEQTLHSFCLNSSKHSAFSAFVTPFTVRMVTRSSSVPSGMLRLTPHSSPYMLCMEEAR